ncbi:hypothetical protein LINPERPRIM_LOCUS36020 [Linum perenne]
MRSQPTTIGWYRKSHMLRPSTLLETSFSVIGRCRLSMHVYREGNHGMDFLASRSHSLVFIVLSLAILYCLTGFSMTSSVFLKNV